MDLESAPFEIIKPAQELTLAALDVLRQGKIDGFKGKWIRVQCDRAVYQIWDVDVSDWTENPGRLGCGLFIDRIELGANGEPSSFPDKIQLPRSFGLFRKQEEVTAELYHLRSILPESLALAVQDLKSSHVISKCAWLNLLKKANCLPIIPKN
jgi:hypothetical protein